MNWLDLGYGVAGVLLAPWWARKARGGWRERFGHVEAIGGMRDSNDGPGGARIMVHAVSVGEVNATRALVPLLARHAEVILTVSTDTGMARARSLFAGAERVRVLRFPLDFSRCVRRFLDAVRPDAVGLVELEVWPNFIAECERRLIPVAVINGRLSENSHRGYRRVRSFVSPTFGRLNTVAAQDADYAERFVSLGVPAERVEVTGSMKWDSASLEDRVEGADGLAAAMDIDRTKPLVVGGSTAVGEEALLVGACPDGVQLLCAPRKPERFEEAAAAMPGCIRRSSRLNGGAPTGSNGSAGGRFLLDTIGELRAAYSLADVVVMGRTFTEDGGSDPIEPVGLGKVTVIGPGMRNFLSVVELFRRGGGGGWSGADSNWKQACGVVSCSAGELGGVIRQILANRESASAVAERGRACIRSQQGASRKHAELLLSLAYGSPPPRVPLFKEAGGLQWLAKDGESQVRTTAAGTGKNGKANLPQPLT